MIIFLIRWITFITAIVLAVTYFYLDCWGGNHCTITHQIQAYALDIYSGIGDFVTYIMRLLSDIA